MDRSEQRNTGEVVNGRYLIERLLGAGAMGQVFLAQDGILHHRVAMKYLLWRPNRTAAVAGFKSEFATLARLHHPNITRVFDFAQDEVTGHFFFTSEYIDGTDFFYATEHCSPASVERLGVQALRALEYLHRHQIFHFDIKPQNVLVAATADNTDNAESDATKLIDFGLAAVSFQDKLVGTPSYIAPEMIRRETPDHRADLYSLGVLLYYALARWNPFRAPTREETFNRHINCVPPPLQGHCQGVPDYLAAMIHKLLAKRPEERFASATEVIHEVNRHTETPYTLERPMQVATAGTWETHYIGRETAMAEATACLRACVQGTADRPLMLWICGEPGTGKTRFLKEIKFAAQLSGFATHIFDRTDITARMAWLAALDSAREEPSTSVIFFIDDIGTLIQEQSIMEVAEGIQSLLQTTREHLQCSALGMPSRILVVIASNDEADLLHQIERVFRLRPDERLRIPLINFSRSELAHYLQALLSTTTPPPSIEERLFEFTEGNPLFVTETLRQLVQQEILLDAEGQWKASALHTLDLQAIGLPPTIEAIATKEFERLSPEVQRLVQLIAVWGTPVTQEQLASAAHIACPREEYTILIEQGLLSYDPLHREYRFRSRTKRGAIYQLIDPNVRMDLHDQVANNLNRDGGASLERIYFHRARGRAPNAVDRALWELARQQLTAHHYRGAVQTLRVLLQESHFESGTTGAIEIRLLLARLHRELHQFTAAQLCYAALLPMLTQDERQRVRMAQLYEDLGLTAMSQHDYEAGEKAFTEALALLANDPDHQPMRLRIENCLAQRAMFLGDIDSAVSTYEITARAAAQLSPDEQLTINNNDLGIALSEQGRYDIAETQLQQDIERSVKAGQQHRELRARYHLALTRLLQQNDQQARTAFEELFQKARQVGNVEYFVKAAMEVAHLDRLHNRCESSIDWYQRAYALADRLDNPEQRADIALELGRALKASAQITASVQYLRLSLAMVPTVVNPSEKFFRTQCHAHFHLGTLYKVHGPRDAMANYHLTRARELADAHAMCRYLLPDIERSESLTYSEMSASGPEESIMLE